MCIQLFFFFAIVMRTRVNISLSIVAAIGFSGINLFLQGVRQVTRELHRHSYSLFTNLETRPDNNSVEKNDKVGHWTWEQGWFWWLPSKNVATRPNLHIKREMVDNLTTNV